MYIMQSNMGMTIKILLLYITSRVACFAHAPPAVPIRLVHAHANLLHHDDYHPV